MDAGILFEEADVLLKRDWALHIDDIDELLWRLNEEEFQKLLQHKREYPSRVKTLLDFYSRKTNFLMTN